jgi:hypothetical protein
LPENYGTGEPLRIPFDLNKCIDELDDNIFPLIFFVRRNPKLKASIFYRKRQDIRPTHSSLKISLSSKDKEIEQESMLSLLETLAVTFKADFAYAHIATELDVERGGTNDVVSHDYPDDMVVSTHQLRRSIPDLYWFTILGRPYCQLIGQSKLLQTPIYAAKQLSNCQVSLQMTPDIMHCVNRQEEFELVRAKARDYLDENAIHDPSLPEAHKYNVPEFIFE